MDRLVILGNPQGKGRPRFFRGHAYTDKRTRDYEKLVKQTFMASGLQKIEGSIGMEIIAYYPIRKNMTKKDRQLAKDRILLPNIKPDVDNVAKIICDSLNSLLYNDDKDICAITILKFFDDEPRVEVTAWPL